MIDNRILNTGTNCKILSGSLFDDLQSFSTNEQASIITFADNSNSAITSKFDKLDAIFNQNYAGLSVSSYAHTWLPLFVKDDTHVDNKALSADGYYMNANPNLISGRLGIENFYKFKPSFKTLTTSGGDMTTDWILNRPENPKAIYYGLMLWFKIVPPSVSTTDGPVFVYNSFSMSDFYRIGNGGIFYIANGPEYTKYIKLDSEHVRPVTEKSSAFNNSAQLEHKGSDKSIVSIQSLVGQTFSRTGRSSSSSASIVLSSNPVHLWIPDGDMFCFYNAAEEEGLLGKIGIPTRSYVSPSLHQRYTQIYRILTLDEKRLKNPKTNLSRSRCFKKLAHLFSTSPFISDFAINSMDYIDFKLLVNAYILEQERNTTVEQEIATLRKYAVMLSRVLQASIARPTSTDPFPNDSLFLDIKPSQASLINNLAIKKSQVFDKLINKYGATLEIKQDVIISKKPDFLIDNAGIVITQVVSNFCAKGLADTTVFNNQEIKFDANTISTKITNTETKIDITNNGSLSTSIPLYDMAKPSFPGNDQTKFIPRLLSGGFIPGRLMSNGMDTEFPANENTYIYRTAQRSAYFSPEGNGGVTSLRLGALFYNAVIRSPEIFIRSEKYLEDKTSYLWTILSGKGGSFESTGFEQPQPQSTDAEPLFFPDGYYKYIIQCRVNTPFGSFTKIRTIYVVSGADLLAPGLTNPNKDKYFDTETGEWKNPPSPDAQQGDMVYSGEFQPLFLNKANLRVHCSNFNRVAISNVGGVFWPVNTEFSVKEFLGTTASGKFRVPSVAIYNLNSFYKFNIVPNTTEAADTNFSILYKPNNTIIKVHSIILEKIRSDRPGCSNCTSLYEPSVAGRKETIVIGGGSAEFGVNLSNALRYRRQNKYPATFELYAYEWDFPSDRPKPGEPISFDFPIISSDFAPPVKTYGGYDRNFLDTYSIPRISGLALPNDTRVPYSGQLVSNNFVVLPPSTGYKLDYRASVPIGSSNEYEEKAYKVCYQKALPATTGGILNFVKGVFHPTSGWISHTSEDYSRHANRSSILKFNPGARDSFSFVGPKLQRLKSGSINFGGTNSGTYINAKEFSSSIIINIAPHVQWDAPCTLLGEAADGGNQDAAETDALNQINKEYIDIDYNRSNHGYRYLGGGKPKSLEFIASSNTPINNDEFVTDQSEGVYTYSFAVTGPATLPENRVATDGSIRLRIPRVNDFEVKNAEVKLNFLNYVNTKNLVIRLDIVPATAAVKEIRPQTEFGVVSDSTAGNSRLSSPLRYNKNYFVDQSVPPLKTTHHAERDSRKILYKDCDPIQNGIPATGLSEYLEALIDTHGGSGLAANSSNWDIWTPSNRIVLLNQEHIQNNKYNFQIKFSDNASKNNVLYDHNIMPCPSPTGSNISADGILSVMSGVKLSNTQSFLQTSIFAAKQNIVRTGGEVNVSSAAIGYSDRESCLYSSIIKHNKININNNSLVKLATSTMFKSPVPDGTRQKSQGRGDFGSSTEFKLTILVLDEEDDMLVYDNIVNNQYLTGLENADNYQKSNDIFNSLCSWELILHVGETEKAIPHTNPSIDSYGNCDILSLIDYGKDPSYPGNTYIADLKHHKALLPLANISAPNTLISDGSLCYTGNLDDFGTGTTSRATEFPTYAILNIINSITLAAGVLAGAGLAGLGVISDMIINAPGWRILYDYLQEIAFVQDLQDAGRQVYFPSYLKYPFGSPEKILLNIRKPGDLWHSLEATIFKYSNLPILKPNKYNFIRVKRNFCDYISTFNFTSVDNINFFLDESLIKKIDMSCSSSVTLVGFPKEINGTIFNQGDLVYVTYTPDINVTDPTAIEQCRAKGGLFIVIDKDWIKIKERPSDITEQAWRQQNNYGDLIHSLRLSLFHSHISYNNNLFTNQLYGDMLDGKVISIPNRIPYDIFSVGDSIELYNEQNSKDDDSVTPRTIISATIVKKALIYRDNKLVSVLVLDVSVGSSDRLSPKLDNNIFFVYKNSTTVLDNNQKSLYSTWGLDKNVSYQQDNEIKATTHSTGSYGDISPFVSKNYLFNNIKTNKLKNIYNIFNNNNNDKIKKNKIQFWTYDNNHNLIKQSGYQPSENSQQLVDIHREAYGFPYSADILSDSIKGVGSAIYDANPNFKIISPPNTRYAADPIASTFEDEIVYNLAKNIAFSTSLSNSETQDFMYLKVPSIDNASFSGLYGILEVEEDNVEYVPIAKIEPTGQGEKSLDEIITRVKLIDSDANNSELESKAGDPAFTTLILGSYNIKYIAAHLEKLLDKTKDSGDCYTANPTNINECYIVRTSRTLDKLYKERNELLKILELQTIKLASVTSIDEYGQAVSVPEGEIVYENDLNIVIRPIIGGKPTAVFKNKTTLISRNYKSIFDLPTSHPEFNSNSVLPKIRISVKEDRGHYYVNYEEINKDHYIINIDPTQGCLLDFASNPKILMETEYACEEALPFFQGPGLSNNVCPQFAGVGFSVSGGPEDLDASNGKYRYVIPDATIQQQKADFENMFGQNIAGWKQVTKQRWFNINGDSIIEGLTNDEIVVKSTETYLIPLPYYGDQSTSATLLGNDLSADTKEAPGKNQCLTDTGSPSGYGLLTHDGTRRRFPVRVGNLLNLTDANNLEVMVKRIPRILRGCDLLATIYRYGSKYGYRQVNRGNPLVPIELDSIGLEGSINNNIYQWIALQARPNGVLEYTDLPLFFKLQNEMIFRSFYGSVDKIENKKDLLNSLFPWELIPYEYGTR